MKRPFAILIWYPRLIKALKENEANCEAIYWKGKALKQLGNFEAAIESYEHAVNLNRSQSATLKSLFDLAIIRIQERDIYLAYYTLDRIEEIPEDLPALFHLKIFLNGAVNMIKKKFKDGLEDLKKLDMNRLKECDIESLALSYQAYGLFCLGKIDESQEILKEMEKRRSLVEGDTYNKLLCQGILNGETKKFAEARAYFERARSIFRLKVEPTFYIVVPINDSVSRSLEVYF